MAERIVQPLSSYVQSCIRTGITVGNVGVCVEELVMNAVDAGSTCVAIRIDLSAFKIQVIDNGSGFTKEQLECIGQRYWTSKCNSVKDMEHLAFYGYRGEALKSIIEVSSMLDITSRAKNNVNTYCKLFTKGKPLDVVATSSPRPSAGTTITIHDLFYNLPVRRKTLNITLEMERIRQKIIALALINPKVSFTLRNNSTGQVVLQIGKSSNMLSTLSSIHGLGTTKSISCVIESEGDYKAHAYISKDLQTKKDLQYVYINHRCVLKTKLHKYMNEILRKSLKKGSSGSEYDKLAGSDEKKNSDSPVKSQERHPLYILQINCPFSEFDITFEPSKTMVEFNDWTRVCKFVEKVLNKFLQKEIQNYSRKNTLKNSAESEVREEPCKLSTEGVISAENCTNFMSSACVRKHADNFVKSMDDHGNNEENNTCITQEPSNGNDTIKEFRKSNGDISKKSMDELESGKSDVQGLDTCNTVKQKKNFAVPTNSLDFDSTDDESNKGPISPSSGGPYSDEDPLALLQMSSHIRNKSSNQEDSENCLIRLYTPIAESTKKEKSILSKFRRFSYHHNKAKNQTKHRNMISMALKRNLHKKPPIDKTSKVTEPQKVSLETEGKASGLSIAERLKKCKAKNGDNCFTALIGGKGGMSDRQCEDPWTGRETRSHREPFTFAGQLKRKIHLENRPEENEIHKIGLAYKNSSNLGHLPMVEQGVPQKLLKQVKRSKEENPSINSAEKCCENCWKTPSTYKTITQPPPVNLAQHAKWLNSHAGCIENNSSLMEADEIILQSTSMYTSISAPIPDPSQRTNKCVCDLPDTSRPKMTPKQITLGTLESLGMNKRGDNKDEKRQSSVVPSFPLIQALDPERERITVAKDLSPKCVDMNYSLSNSDNAALLDSGSKHGQENCLGRFAVNFDNDNSGESVFRSHQDMKNPNIWSDTQPFVPMDGPGCERDREVHVCDEIELDKSPYQRSEGFSPMLSTSPNSSVMSVSCANDEQKLLDELFSGAELANNSFDEADSMTKTENSAVEMNDVGTFLHEKDFFAPTLAVNSSVEVNWSSQLTGGKKPEPPLSVFSAKNENTKENTKILTPSNPSLDQHLSLESGLHQNEAINSESAIPGNAAASVCNEENRVTIASEQNQDFETPISGSSQTPGWSDVDEQVLVALDDNTAQGYVVSDIVENRCESWIEEKEDDSCLPIGDVNKNVSDQDYDSDVPSCSSSRMEKLFEDWENPIFPRSKVLESSVDPGIIEPFKFNKSVLQHVKVIGQMDKKFIMCLFAESCNDENLKDLLVAFDQHAVHERIRLELFLKDIYAEKNEFQFKVYKLDSSECVNLSLEEVRVLEAYESEVNRLGISFSVVDSENISVASGPLCLVDGDMTPAKKKRYITQIQVLLKEHIQLLQQTEGCCNQLPGFIHRTLCSRACHGAIKFGDLLSNDECQDLLKDLQKCDFPFQCAHGRPSVVPLINLTNISQNKTRRTNLQKLLVLKK